MIEVRVYENEKQFAKQNCAFAKRVENIDGIMIDYNGIVKTMRTLYGHASVVEIINF